MTELSAKPSLWRRLFPWRNHMRVEGVRHCTFCDQHQHRYKEGRGWYNTLPIRPKTKWCRHD